MFLCPARSGPSFRGYMGLLILHALQVFRHSSAAAALFKSREKQLKQEVLEWDRRMKEYLARAESAEKGLAAAREALKGRDAAALMLRNRLAVLEAKVARADADMREAQASWVALRLRDASDAVDIGAYNILVGRIDVLEAADGGEVGAWKLSDVRAEMRKWFPAEAGAPGVRLVEFLEEHKGTGEERSGSAGSGTI